MIERSVEKFPAPDAFDEQYALSNKLPLANELLTALAPLYQGIAKSSEHSFVEQDPLHKFVDSFQREIESAKELVEKDKGELDLQHLRTKNETLARYMRAVEQIMNIPAGAYEVIELFSKSSKSDS